MKITNKSILLLFVIFIILFLIPNSFAMDLNQSDDTNDILTVSGDTFYVSTTGNDTNDGSEANPLATIQRALTLSTANNQSQIYISSGVYNESNLEIISNVNIIGSGNVTIDAQSKGRIFTIDDNLNVNLENLILTNGQGRDDIYVPYAGYQNGAGAVYVKDSLVRMNNLTFINNEAGAYGGAVVWDGRNGKITKSTFINNYAGSSGGAIDWLGDYGTIEDCVFILNQADNGGALFYEGYVLNLYDSHFEENIAGWGGAISIISVNQNDDNYVLGNTFIKNQADSYGGAIVLDNEELVSCSSYTIISKNNFENNSAAYGGAISAYYANADILNNNFVNHAAVYGGVIASSGVIYLENNTMKNSTATTLGNDVYNVGTFEGFLNIVFMEGKTVEVSGNSIMLNATVTDDMGNKISGGSVKFTVNNTETLYSPSILTEGFCHVAFSPRQNGTYVISGNYGNVGDRYSNITVGFIVVKNASADYFGPIYLSESMGDDGNIGNEMSPVKTFEVAYSLATRDGGSRTIIIKPGKYDVARYDVEYKSFTIIGEGNPILDAGDKFMFSFIGYSTTIFNITGVTLANGYASPSTYAGNYAGGAIFFKGGHLYLENVSFINNTAEDFGGALHVNKGFNLNTGATFIGEATIINCTFDNNQVIGHDSYDRNVGGAISTYGGTVTIINSTFNNNYARFGGALGIEQYHGGMTIINSTFTNNEAIREGGALYVGTVSPFTAEIYNSTFDSNTAVNGGAIFIASGVIDNSTFTNNKANKNGGALITEGNEVITNNRFINNTANGIGGAIVVNKNPSQVFTDIFKIQLENNTVSDCKAANASEIYLDSELEVSGLIITVLDNMTKYFSPDSISIIYANLTDNMGNLITTNNFTFIINGYAFDSIADEGLATVEKLITVNDNGALVTAEVMAGDKTLTVKTGIIKLTTGKIIVDFDDASGHLKEDISVLVYVIDGDGNPIASGFVNASFNSNNFTAPINDGIANVTITLPGEVGSYPLTVAYNDVSATRNVNVTKATPEICIEVSDAFVGDSQIINVTSKDDITGNVTITVDGTVYSKELVNASACLVIFNLTNKTYIVEVDFAGDENYNGCNANASFEVFKIANEITIKTDEISEGENLSVVVSAIEDATGDIIITVDNQNYTESIENGTAAFNIAGLKAGEYELTAVYVGDEKYLESTSKTSVIVSKVSDFEIKVNSTPVRQGENTTVIATLPGDASGKVSVKIANRTYEADVENGTAVLNITDLAEGIYDAEIVYSGDAKYVQKSVNETITVLPPKNVILTVDDVEKYFGGSERLVINLVDINGNPLNNVSVYVSLNGATYQRMVENGTASLGLNLNSGEYDVYVLFNGSDVYDQVDANASVIIKNTVISSDLVKIYRNESQFYATFVDSMGNPLNKTVVSFNINGVFYNRTTDENGVAKLNINLNPGKYIITSINTKTGENAANNVTVLSKITENHDLVKYYKNASQYYVKILDDQGNPVGAGVTVRFNINGVFYERQTNESGVARLNINLEPGKYIITAEYEGCMMSNNITVLGVLYAEDMEMHYQDGSQFEALLLDGVGEPLNEATITFNINGVFYDRLTDGDGIARLKIRLMAGEYIITSSYNGLNIANRITIV